MVNNSTYIFEKLPIKCCFNIFKSKVELTEMNLVKKSPSHYLSVPVWKSHGYPWYSQKGHTYLNKPATFSCLKYVWSFSGRQALKSKQTLINVKTWNCIQIYQNSTKLLTIQIFDRHWFHAHQYLRWLRFILKAGEMLINVRTYFLEISGNFNFPYL